MKLRQKRMLRRIGSDVDRLQMLIEILDNGRLQCVALDSRPEAMSTSSVKTFRPSSLNSAEIK
jgi:hypothetical protein